MAIIKGNSYETSRVLTIVLGSFLILRVIFNAVKMAWHAIGDGMQTAWDKTIETLGVSDGTFHLLGVIFLPLVVYWALGLLFLYVDVTGRPKWILKYKIQDPNANYPVDKSRLLGVMKQVIFNQGALQVPLSILLTYLQELRGYQSGPLPSLLTLLLDFAVFLVIEEFMFYYGHRLLHHPRLYKYIHKKHHEWQTPIALTAVYCHPIEHFLSNMLPVAVGPLFMRSHSLTTFLWIMIASSNAVITHSGYHLPLLPSPEAHDYHHLKFNQNYGVTGFLDWLHGTDIMFRQTKGYERHILLFSLLPIKQLIPDVTDLKTE